MIAAIVQSAGSDGRLHHRFGARGGVDAGAGQCLAQLGVAGWVGDHRALGPQRDGLLGQQPALRPATRARTWKRSGSAGEQFDRLGADAAGAAEDGDAARCRGHCQRTTPRPG